MNTGYSRLIFKDQCYVSYCIYASHHIDVFLYVRLFTPTYKLRLMDGIHLLGWNLERISFQKRKIVLDFDTPVLLGLSHLRDVHPSF